MTKENIVGDNGFPMELTVGERYSSPTEIVGDSPQIVHTYVVKGTWRKDEAFRAALTYLGRTYGTEEDSTPYEGDYPLLETRIKPLAGAPAFEVEATFGIPPYDQESEVDEDTGYVQAEDSDYEFSTSGGTARITHGIGTVSITPNVGAVARDFGGGIGIDENGGFDGCEIITPHAQTSLSVNLPKAFLSRPYRILLAQLTGAINSAPFDGFAAGELLFRGVRAKPVWYYDPSLNARDYYWRATYSFEASPNTTIPFAGVEIPKLGWDYAWRAVEKTENATTGETDYYVRQINVERVYPWFDFAALCVGTPE